MPFDFTPLPEPGRPADSIRPEVTPGWSPDRMRAAINAEAARRITEIAPDWRQRNMLARAIELLALGELTAEQADERAAIEQTWAQIAAIRAASDVLIEDAAKLPEEGQRSLNVQAWKGWP